MGVVYTKIVINFEYWKIGNFKIRWSLENVSLGIVWFKCLLSFHF